MEIAGYIAAILIGITLGLVGGGGSILTVPVMVYLFLVPPQLATCYSLFVVGITSLAGVITRLKTGNVKFRIAMLFGTTSIITVFLIRKFIIPLLPTVLFSIGNFVVTESLATMVLFAVLMLMSATSMIKSSKKKFQTANKSSLDQGMLALYGMGIGLVTGFLGAGGGFLIIPALIFLCKLNMKEAVGTSLLIIAANSLVGFTGDIGHFNIDWRLLAIVTTLAITGIIIGTQLAKKINNENLKKAFGWFVLVMATYIIIKEIFL